MREKKGRSLIEDPKDFVIIDIETTGLMPDWDNIIEIGSIKYKNNIL